MEFGSVELLQEAVNATKDRQRKDLLAKDSKNDELLSSVDLDLKDLTPRTNELLSEMALYNKASNLRDLNPMSLYCWNYDLEMEKMEYEPIILELEQNTRSIEKRIKKDSDELETFREDLATVKEKINKESQTDDHIKKKCSIDNKISNYKSKYNELTMRLSKFKIPFEILPESFKQNQIELQNLKSKCDELKIIIDQRTLVMSAKKDLRNLKLNQTPMK